MPKYLAIHHERCISFDDMADAQAFVRNRAASYREHWHVVAAKPASERLSWLPEAAAAIGMLILFGIIGVGFAGLPAWPEATYSAIIADARGDNWIIDTRLSWSDCEAYRAKYGEVECRTE